MNEPYPLAAEFVSHSGLVRFSLAPYPDALHETVLREICDLITKLTDIVEEQRKHDAATSDATPTPDH
jgi:hypothetical protein